MRLVNSGLVRWSTPVVAELDFNKITNSGSHGKSIIIGTAGTGSGGWIYVLSANGAIRTGWPRPLPSEIASSPAVGDIDGDGFPEIVVGCGTAIPADLPLAGRVFAFKRDGSPFWQFSPEDTDENGQPDHVYGTPAIGDIDGDGIADVVFGSYDFWIYALKGSTGQSLPGWPAFARDSVWTSAALSDLDGDGRLEIIIGADSHPEGPPVNWKAGGTLFVLRSDGTNFPGFPQFVTPPVGQEPVGFQSSPVVGDIDGDGCPEIVLGTGYSPSPAQKVLYAFKVNGAQASGWPVTLNDHCSTSPALADLTGDGTLDVVATDDKGYVYALRGNGNPIFAPFRPKRRDGTALAVKATNPVVAQVGTNNPAILVGSVDWDVAIISKTGAQISDDGTHGGRLTYTTGNAVSGPLVADLDGTGQLTLIAASQIEFEGGGPHAGIYAWPLGTASQGAAPWPTMRRDPARSGSVPSSTPGVCLAPPPPSRFFTVPPCRVADSRLSGNLSYAGPAYVAGEQRTITITDNPWNPCHSVPATAKAVALNVTVTRATTLGHLRLYPAGNGAPLASTINYLPGQTRANNAIVPLSYDGRGSLTVGAFQATGTVDVILDITGYFQ